MKKFQRALIAVMCVICLAFGVIACGNDTPSSGAQATYTVTVKGGSAMMLETTKVKLIDANGNDAASKYLTDIDETNLTGKASFKLKKATYTVEVSGAFGELVPTGIMTLTPNYLSTTIELKKEEELPDTVEYKVLFTLPDSTPVPKLNVQLCSDTNCFTSITGDDGWASWDLAPTTYEIHVPEMLSEDSNWPEGYYFDDTQYTISVAERNGKTAAFKAYIKQTVQINYAVDVGEAGDPVADLALDIHRYSEENGKIGDKVKTVTTGADGSVTFDALNELLAVRVPNPPAGYMLETGAATVLYPPEAGAAATPLSLLLYEAGTYQYARITLKEGANTVELSADRSALWYDVVPARSGMYSLTSSGSLDAYANMYTYNGGFVNTDTDWRDTEPNSYAKTGDNFTLSFAIGESMVGTENRHVFKIGAEGVTAAGSLTVTLTRTGDYEEPTGPAEKKVVPQEIKDAADLPAIPEESKFAFLNDGDAITKGDDGYYHLGDGTLVYATLGKKYPAVGISGGFEAAIAGSFGSGFTFTDEETYNYNYASFVETYVQKAGEEGNGDYLHLNADGLHPLNDELKTFLDYYRSRLLDAPKYYAVGRYVNLYAAPDASDSEGVDYKVKTGTYSLEIAAETTVVIEYKPTVLDKYNALVKILSGAAKLLDGDGEETDTAVVAKNGTFSIKNEGAAAAVVRFGVELQTADPAVELTATGTYLLKADSAPHKYAYTFKAPAAGKYSFESDGPFAAVAQKIDVDGGIDYESLYDIRLEEGETVVFYLDAFNGDPYGELTIEEMPDAPDNLWNGENAAKANAAGVEYKFMAMFGLPHTFTADSDNVVIYTMVGGTRKVLYDGATGVSTPISIEAWESISVFCESIDGSAISFTLTITTDE